MRLGTIAVIATAVLLAAGAAGAEEKKGSKLDGAKNTVDRIREADPPGVSTTTKPSPLGQSTTDYKPTGPSVKPKEPPAPTVKGECHPSLGWRTRQALGC